MSYKSRHLKRRIRRLRYGRKKINPQIENYIVLCLAILCIILILIFIKEFIFPGKIVKVKPPLKSVAAFQIPYKTLSDLQYLSDKYSLDFAELVTLYSIENNFFPEKTESPTVSEIETKYILSYSSVKGRYAERAIRPYVELLSGIFEDIKAFPIAYRYEADGQTPYIFGDSWNESRSFGSKREHKGTDIMDRENIRGRIAVVSMTGGTLRDMGWNELGGYHIGIVSGNDNYYYYAHLDSFAEGLVKGDQVVAGQFLGYMGDSGYGLEGTKGEFAVHLHVGIAPSTSLTLGEFWINPYPFLRWIEN